MNRLDRLGIVVLENSFIKSPPTRKLDNLSSWRERHFSLVEVTNNDEKLKFKSKKGKLRDEETEKYAFYVIYWKTELERKKEMQPIRIIPVKEDTQVYLVSHPMWPDKYEHVLQLKTPERTFYFCADDYNVKISWYEMIKRIVRDVSDDIANNHNDAVEKDAKNVNIVDGSSYRSTTKRGSRKYSSRSSVGSMTSLESDQFYLSSSFSSNFKDNVSSRHDSGISVRSSLQNMVSKDIDEKTIEAVYEDMRSASIIDEETDAKNNEAAMEISPMEFPLRKAGSIPTLHTPVRVKRRSVVDYPKYSNIFQGMSSTAPASSEFDKPVPNPNARRKSSVYDIPTSPSRVIKREVFFELSVDLPYNSVVERSTENVMIIRTQTSPSTQWIITRNALNEKTEVTTL